MLTAQTNVYPLPDELQAKIDLVLESHDNDPTQIVGILLEVQDLNERHYVPEPIAYYLADRLSMPVTNVFDCLNFYRELSSKPRAKYPIQVCSSPACRVNVIDTKRLLETLENLLDIKIGETITAHIDIDARQWENRWFNSIYAWKIERASDSGAQEQEAPQQSPSDIPQSGQQGDALPF